MKNHPFKMLAGKRNLAALAIGLVLLLYISFLIFSNYLSQVELQKTALGKLRQDTEMLAMSVCYFCAERKIDLKNLAENRAISVYFENKALGMSMDYGLKASLNAIIYQFDRLLEEKKFGGNRIYSRITFIRPNGELLVDTGLINFEQDQVRDWNKFLTPDSREVAFIDEHNPQIPMMIITIPYFLKGNFSGQIIAWVNLVDIYEHFAKKGGPSNGYTSFVSIKDHIYSAEYMQAKFSSFLPELIDIEMGKTRRYEVTDNTGIKRDIIVIRVPIKRTPLSLTRAMPASDILGRRSPFHLLVAMAVLSIAVMIGMVFFWRVTTNNLILEARFEEASKRRQEIEEKNRRLEKEINERKKAEETLRQSEEKYKILVMNIPSIVYRGYKDWSVEFFDRKVGLITGYDVDEFNSRKIKWSDIIIKEDIKDVRESFIKAIKTDKSYVREYRIKSKAGNIHWLHERGHIVCNEKGEIDHVSGTFFDITEHKQLEEALQKAHDELERRVEERTDKLAKANEQLLREIDERKQMEGALRESEEKHRTFMEANPDPAVVYDMEGQVAYFNPAFTRVFGWTHEECLDKEMGVFVPEEAWPETNMMINKMMAGERISGFETSRHTKEGNIIPVNISGAIYRDKDGNRLGSIINLRDISEQKKLEDQLQSAQKMEALGILAGGVAHDLNNVLTGIVTYPDLLLMQIPEDSPLIKPILTMQSSGKKVADIVQDLLNLARRGVVVEEVVNLNEIISEYFKAPEHEKLKSFHPGVEIETSLESNLFNTSGSPVHLSKAVMNLVSNAAEAMPDGGKILISTENRYIDRPISGYESIEEGDYITLTVSDTGIGISPEDKGRIFEPFYTKKLMGRSGTGLGMAVVWTTVKDHKGYIVVQSTEGKGTTFTLYFPATRRARDKEKTKLPIENYMGKGESILVVDDVRGQREIVFNLLTTLGYVVDTVSSGEKAVDYMKNKTADLLILDMIMDPGIDGLDTYKKIIEIYPEQKAIIASGFSETGRVRKAQNLGAGQYIKKPYTLEKIGIVVRAELDK